MNAAADLEMAEAARADIPVLGMNPGNREEETHEQKLSLDISREEAEDVRSKFAEDGIELPTAEDIDTLQRVSGKIPWTAFTIAFIELCERFSYYGTTAVFVNFIQQPLPPGSNTGAGFSGQSGALDMGQRASTGLTTFNTFWAYIMPLFGAYLADTYWGRFKTIQISCGVAIIGHIVLIMSAIPQVIVYPHVSIALFAVGIVIMGVGVGGFKSNISPLIAEQCPEKTMLVKTISESPSSWWRWNKLPAEDSRVIMDPAVTIQRVYTLFYLLINVGSLMGSISMVYAEKYVGFWLAFTLPTLMLALCPLVTLFCKERYILVKPTGSVLLLSIRLWNLAMKGRWSWNPITFRKNIRAPDFWENVKPSKLGNSKPSWMTFDDAWVEEIRRGLLACSVFLWYPIYWLAYGQMTNNLTSQAATLKLNGVPNDIISNFNPLFIIVLIPLMDCVIYPQLRQHRINFSPIKRIAAGFFLASCAMVSACVVQYYIYKLSPCGNEASDCEEPADIAVWVQLVPYGLIGFSEILASITSLEYAYTKAPRNMKSSVTAICLFMNAISSALSQALVALSADPLLVWNYGAVAVIALIGGVLFYLTNSKLDEEEDSLNALPSAMSEHMPGSEEDADNMEMNDDVERNAAKMA